MAKEKISPSDYPKGLKQALIDLPHVETAYVKGSEWHFIERKGFTAIDREDVLGEEK